ncbi:type II toxin-antitoxin system VapC family toxin [Roseibium suaedae]|uniref:Predicted nucleic acid-binding protein, contains PIN domain n=1 Tax=Roseibium suaedae TaxID=735517 RepID=A0A1M6Z6P6_9HYPH|nr:type II toxin-antitoxin system VapC family toxin [Roseibium suaedae]SHL26156.1 Predicted nucleic acid-binding protein, contains PIN domain [Roseibium suaedae]
MVRLYLDTNVFILALQGAADDVRADTARRLFFAVEDGTLSAVTSELALAEVLSGGGSQRQLPQLLKEQYLDLMVSRHLVELVPLVRDDMYLAADLSGSQSAKVRLPDRLHLATAIRVKADYFVSDDRMIDVPAPLEKCGLTETLPFGL